MPRLPIAAKKRVTPPVILFLETRHRITGLVREIYIARGWIKKTGYDESHYQVTPKGAKFLNA
jgi:hypothetical protein